MYFGFYSSYFLIETTHLGIGIIAVLFFFKKNQMESEIEPVRYVSRNQARQQLGPNEL